MLASIESNLRSVHERISDAAARSGRNPDQIRLVAISKSQPAEAVRAAYTLGLREFGENRVQEGLEKQADLSDLPDLQWHMVGHIQSRKARDVPAHFDLVHSVDRLKIARLLDQQAGDDELRLPVLLECNVSGEGSKYGWDMSEEMRWDATGEELRKLSGFGNLEIRGLMTMAPWVDDEQVVRATFANLRRLRDFLQEMLEFSLPELSMGMTDDFELAIEEGATVVRIGRAIFGPRAG